MSHGNLLVLNTPELKSGDIIQYLNLVVFTNLFHFHQNQQQQDTKYEPLSEYRLNS